MSRCPNIYKDGFSQIVKKVCYSLLDIGVFFFSAYLIDYSNFSFYNRFVLYFLFVCLFFDIYAFEKKQFFYLQSAKIIFLSFASGFFVISEFSLIVWIVAFIKKINDIYFIKKYGCILFRKYSLELFYYCFLLIAFSFSAYLFVNNDFIVLIRFWNFCIRHFLDNKFSHSTLTTVLSANFIFNFTAMFILLQENHGKFENVSLFESVINGKIIFRVIVIPACFILTEVSKIVTEKYYLMLCVLGISYGIYSSVFLLRYLRTALDSVAMFKRLIKTVTREDMLSYMNQNSPIVNKRLDSLLSFVKGLIDKKRVLETETIFKMLFQWMNENIDAIGSETPCEIRENRFNIFLQTLVESLEKSGSSIMKRNFANTITGCMLLKALDKGDLKKYRMLYDVLKSIALKELESETSDGVEIAYICFCNILLDSHRFLQKIPETKAEFGMAEFEEPIHSYEDMVLNNVERIITKAIEIGNWEFLRKVDLCDSIFRTHRMYENEPDIWNNNFLLAFNHIDYTLQKIAICNISDRRLIRSVLSDLRQMEHLIMGQDLSRKVIRKIFKACLYRTQDIYIELIKKGFEFTNRDFENLYEPLWMNNGNVELQKMNFNRFSFVLDTYLTKYKMEDEKVIFKIYSRFRQVGNIFKRERFSDEIQQIFSVKDSELISKHQVLQGYDAWEKAEKEAW